MKVKSYQAKLRFITSFRKLVKVVDIITGRRVTIIYSWKHSAIWKYQQNFSPKYLSHVAEKNQNISYTKMVFTCVICKRGFPTLRGHNIHYVSCKRKERNYVKRMNSVNCSIDVTESQDIEPRVETALIVESDVLPLLVNDECLVNPPCHQTPTKNINANLPPFIDGNRLNSTTTVNTLPGDDFVNLVDSAYNETIFWKKNLFMLPSGKAAKLFILELSFWIDQFNRDTKLQHIALKVFMLLPNLLLQKPSKESKAKEHNTKLADRLQLWKEGKIKLLLKEGRTIQKRITTSKRRSQTDTSKLFAKLMLQGKVSAALKILSDDDEHGVLPPTDETIEELKKKHPPPAAIQKETLLQGPLQEVESFYFDNINADLIRIAARQTKGAAGPSKLDAEQFKAILCSKKFKHEGQQLCENIATMAKKVATEVIDPTSPETYVACKLIPLNKNPGIRPIGIGETLRRIIGKTVGWVLKNDIQEVAGPLQVATGLESGAEAAIHAMRQIFEHEDCEAVILVDADNAFNSLNRQVALHNIQYLCPQFATILINTYRNPSRLIINGGKELLSQEGTTQGDNLAMAFYALSTVLMQNQLRSVTETKQVWLSDDATGAGKIPPLKRWLDVLIVEGKKCGYFIKESKSWIISKSEDIQNTAKEIFKNTSIKFTTSGKRHLGASIGSKQFRDYVSEKVVKWCKELEILSTIVSSEPQAAFAACFHSRRS